MRGLLLLASPFEGDNAQTCCSALTRWNKLPNAATIFSVTQQGVLKLVLQQRNASHLSFLSDVKAAFDASISLLSTSTVALGIQTRQAKPGNNYIQINNWVISLNLLPRNPMHPIILITSWILVHISTEFSDIKITIHWLWWSNVAGVWGLYACRKFSRVYFSQTNKKRRRRFTVRNEQEIPLPAYVVLAQLYLSFLLFEI